MAQLAFVRSESVHPALNLLCYVDRHKKARFRLNGFDYFYKDLAELITRYWTDHGVIEQSHIFTMSAQR